MLSETNDKLDDLFKKYFHRASQSGYGIFKGHTLPLSFDKGLKDIEDLEVYDDDVWVCSYPKTGTTWTQVMVWCICNNLDLEAAKEDLDTRYVLLELSCFFVHKKESDQSNPFLNSIEEAKTMKRPRFIKTHLPWELLPKQIRAFEKRPKIVYVTRNPMDSCVSAYHFNKLLGIYTGDLETFTKLFLNAKVGYTAFEKAVLSFWKRKDEPNLLFLKYEDMKADISSVVDTVAKFLNVELTEGDKVKLMGHISFDSMKGNRSVNHSAIIEFAQKANPTHDAKGSFMRSGKSGGYRTELSEETIGLFKTQILDEFEEAGLTFAL